MLPPRLPALPCVVPLLMLEPLRLLLTVERVLLPLNMLPRVELLTVPRLEVAEPRLEGAASPLEVVTLRLDVVVSWLRLTLPCLPDMVRVSVPWFDSGRKVP